MLTQCNPTYMNGKFTYGSQQSSNSLSVDSHRPSNIQQALSFFHKNDGGGDNKKNILFVAPASPP
eukprot:10513418-Ditylum_brightwellii.AAC.1